MLKIGKSRAWATKRNDNAVQVEVAGLLVSNTSSGVSPPGLDMNAKKDRVISLFLCFYKPEYSLIRWPVLMTIHVYFHIPDYN